MDITARYRADVVRDARALGRSVSTYVWWVVVNAISDRKAK